ncbi:MAG: hypothetical protein AB1899_07355 [Pseudomonadota bacterium]
MKAETHKLITELALNAYIQAQRRGEADIFLNERYRQCVIEGTDWEDALSFDRLVNWHFYPANDLLRIPLWGFVYANSSRIVAERQRELIDEVQHGFSERLFTRFGRLLHHIQDMSTPSHVVPVYHGPGKPDPYEDYLTHDGDYLSRAHGATWPALHEITPPDQFTDLYNSAAQITQAALSPAEMTVTLMIDGVPSQTNAGLFWLTHEQVNFDGEATKHYAHGFGGFGILGAHFGDTRVISVGTHEYQISLQEFRRIAVAFFNKAIGDSITALRVFDAILAAHH